MTKPSDQPKNGRTFFESPVPFFRAISVLLPTFSEKSIEIKRFLWYDKEKGKAGKPRRQENTAQIKKGQEKQWQTS